MCETFTELQEMDQGGGGATLGRSRVAPQGTLPWDRGAWGCGRDACHPSHLLAGTAGRRLPRSTSTASLPAPRHASHQSPLKLLLHHSWES